MEIYPEQIDRPNIVGDTSSHLTGIDHVSNNIRKIALVRINLELLLLKDLRLSEVHRSGAVLATDEHCFTFSNHTFSDPEGHTESSTPMSGERAAGGSGVCGVAPINDPFEHEKSFGTPCTMGFKREGEEKLVSLETGFEEFTFLLLLCVFDSVQRGLGGVLGVSRGRLIDNSDVEMGRFPVRCWTVGPEGVDFDIRAGPSWQLSVLVVGAGRQLALSDADVAGAV